MVNSRWVRFSLAGMALWVVALILNLLTHNDHVTVLLPVMIGGVVVQFVCLFVARWNMGRAPKDRTGLR